MVEEAILHEDADEDADDVADEDDDKQAVDGIIGDTCEGTSNYQGILPF